MHRSIRYMLLAAALVAAQVLLLNNLHLRGFLNGYIAPNIYIMFILVQPMSSSRISLLLTSFFLGVVVDLFSGTLGMHAAAATLLGFLRPYVLQRFYNKDNEEESAYPSVYNLGVWRFFYYCMALSFCFHLVLFTLEVFGFSMFYLTVLRALLSALFSVIIIMLIDLLSVRKSLRYR